jgi:uncharacterized protein (DUF58 family)
VAAGLAVLLALALAVSWWTSPTALFVEDERVAARVAVGSPADVTVVPVLPRRGVVLRSVEPVLADGGARADVEVLLCGRPSGGGASLTTAGDLLTTCTSVRPATPGTRTREDESLLVRVVPRERGDVELLGLRVRYTRDARHLWQTGTQALDVDVRVTTP